MNWLVAAHFNISRLLFELIMSVQWSSIQKESLINKKYVDIHAEHNRGDD